MAEAKPSKPGKYYGEYSPLEQWIWAGTGQPEDDWIKSMSAESTPAKAPEVKPQSAPEVKPLAKPVPGTTVPGTTTLATLFNTCFVNQSAQHGTPTFQWSGPNELIANFPAATTQNASSSAMYIRFEARAFYPATIT